MIARRLLVGTLLAALACAPAPDPAPDPAPPPSPAPTTTATTTTAPAPSPSPSPSQEIYIDHIEVANPLVVRGRARTFENNVVLRVLDARGERIVETFTTSTGEIGHHNPYEARIWIVRNPGTRVTVEAFEYSAKDGAVRSLTRRTVDWAVEPIRATLMFPAGDCDRMAAFERELPKSPAMARLLVEALIAGPTASEKASGATAPFPRGSEVRSVILRGGELTVDFNERLQNAGGACAARAIHESVTRTLTRLPSVKSVVITAGGSRELALQP